MNASNAQLTQLLRCTGWPMIGVFLLGSTFPLASYSKCGTIYSNSTLHQLANNVGIRIFLNLSNAVLVVG